MECSPAALKQLAAQPACWHRCKVPAQNAAELWQFKCMPIVWLLEVTDVESWLGCDSLGTTQHTATLSVKHSGT